MRFPQTCPREIPLLLFDGLTREPGWILGSPQVSFSIDSNSKLGYKVCGLQVLVLKFQKNEGHKIDHSSKRRKQ